MHVPSTPFLAKLALASFLIFIAGCSPGQFIARSSLPLLQSGVAAMNRESDLDLAQSAIPSNLKLIESLILELPDNPDLRLNAAQGFYGYAFGFVEDEQSARAAALYLRSRDHALAALAIAGLAGDVQTMTLENLNLALSKLDRSAVPALFWTASAWAKCIDLNRTDPARIAELGKVEALMRRVLELDETYYFGGAHIFFGVWYGGRSPFLGGNFALAEQHFARARTLSQGKILAVDVLAAQYLAVQQHDRHAFHEKLLNVINTPLSNYPEMALANAIAQKKAAALLKKEEELF